MPIKAILFGATGMVGEGVLHVALNHSSVESVLVIGRKPCGVSHPKLQELIHADFYNYSTIEDKLRGYHACFFCLGVTSIGKSEDDYRRITYDLTMAAASALSRLNSGMTFCYISGTGTDSTEKGRSMWARVKGKTENDLAKLPFKTTYAFRPGYIKPIKGLRHAFAASKFIGLFYPVVKFFFAKYVCTLEELGLAMIHSASTGYPQRILENKDIRKLAYEK
ncbi:epimerase [bacterium]|nr:epimerase [bacterium]